MEILALNSQFAPVAYLKYVNLQWTRRYYECGDFSIQIQACQYKSEMKYIYTPNRPETGIIQKIEFESNQRGDLIQLSGFFLEHILNDKIVYPTFYGRGDLELAVHEMITVYKEDIPLLLNPPANIGATATWQETGGQLSDVIYERLKTQELSYRCCFSLVDNMIYFNIYKGLDRTQSQSTNNFVTFSRNWRNLIDARVTSDDSDSKNFAIVAGSGEGADRIVVDVDLSNGNYKKKVYLDRRDVSYDTEKQTLDEYKDELKQKGTEKLLKYVSTFNVDVTADNSRFLYLQHYDLGDKCDIAVDTLSLAMEARIIAIFETVKQGMHTVEIELGDKILTTYEKERL